MPANGLPPSLPEGPLQCCPTCGSALASENIAWDLDQQTFIANGRAIRFSGRQAQIFDAVWRTRFKGGIPSLDRFMTMVYANEIDGGPECSSIISVQLAKMRPRLEEVGYSITYNFGTPRRGFRLVPTSEVEA